MTIKNCSASNLPTSFLGNVEILLNTEEISIDLSTMWTTLNLCYMITVLSVADGNANTSNETTTLYVGALLKLSEYWYAKYALFFLEVFEYAFEEVYARDDMLPGFQLKLKTEYTRVSSCLFSVGFIYMQHLNTFAHLTHAIA